MISLQKPSVAEIQQSELRRKQDLVRPRKPIQCIQIEERAVRELAEYYEAAMQCGDEVSYVHQRR